MIRMENITGSSRNPAGQIYHICSDGLSKEVLFLDRDDYISGMNDIAISSFACGVKILCFCLMSNHVHFIARGTAHGCSSFINKYMRMRKFHLRKRHGANCIVENPEISMIEISGKEYLTNAIAYILRNPVSAGMKIMPGEYLWSSAHLYFAERSLHRQNCSDIAHITYRQYREYLCTSIMLPKTYIINDEHMILPESYVDYEFVEKLFVSPKKLLYCLSRNNDAEMELDSGIMTRPVYQDHELRAELKNICGQMFGTTRLSQLSIREKCLASKELHKRFGAKAKQISRLTRIPVDIISAIL